jgi:hypothetical protein
VVIRNHVGGNFYKSEASTRFFYYPETYADGQGWAHWMPTVWFGGMDEVTGAWSNVHTTRSVYRDKVLPWLYVPTPVDIDVVVEFGEMADSGMVHVAVAADNVVGFNDLRLRIAVTESGINYAQKRYDQILRDYLPDPNGVAFTIGQGEIFTHSEPFVIEAGWAASNCDIVAFVQNDTPDQEMVIQCAQAPVPAPTPVITEISAGNLPEGYRLSQNYPNPFNPETEIQYAIPRDELVTLRVYNVTGAEVAVLVDGQQAAGSYSVRWKAVDLASGVYFCRLQAGAFSETIKMVLMR